MDRYEFIWKAIQKHGYKYDYKKVEYKGNKTKVCIVCPIHGEFWQRPYKHLQGQGCPKCANNIKCSIDIFIEKAKKIHGNKYDYSNVNYINALTKVCIICPEHGEFWQTPSGHLHNKGCSKCSKKCKLSTEEFIVRAKKIHGDKYDYSKTVYNGMFNDVCVTCFEHGEFWQTGRNHLQGKGCPKCNQSHLENGIRILLEQNNIKYEYQKRFNWLGKQSLDFYLPDYNIGIECQGIQHFKPIKYFGGEKGFKYVSDLDNKKYNLCCKHNIKILYFSNEIRKGIFNNENELIKFIEYGKFIY